jgi:hypothetical protein
MNPNNPFASELVIPAPDYPIRGQAAAGIQLIEKSPHSGSIPRLCPLRGLFFLLDSRLRGNDGANGLLVMNTLLLFSDSNWGQGPRP